MTDTHDQSERIPAMTTGGRKLGTILVELLDASKPGVNLLEIEALAMKLIKSAGGSASFQTVEDYQWATCLCVNDDVVHGIPKNRVLQEGDVLTIDVGILFQGYHTDTAWTKIITAEPQTESHKPEVEKFLKTGEETLWKAIDKARAGNHIGDISRVIQQGIEGAGYNVVKSLVGHTVGKELHEKPHVPQYLRGTPEMSPLLVPGMTLAIEIIYAYGHGDIVYANDDGWTLTTKDRSLSAVFEHTILVNESGSPSVLTRWEK